MTYTKLVPLSKNKGSAEAEFDQIRPIAVRSHLSKYMEKALLAKLQSDAHSHLLMTKRY